MDRNAIRRQYACAAPKIPKWFEPIMPERPTTMLKPKFYFDYNSPDKWFGYFWDEGETQEEQWPNEKDWDDEEGKYPFPQIPQEFKDEVSAYLVSYEANCSQIEAWKKEYAVQKIIQWPFFYADRMIAHEKAHPITPDNQKQVDSQFGQVMFVDPQGEAYGKGAQL